MTKKRFQRGNLLTSSLSYCFESALNLAQDEWTNAGASAFK